MKSAIVYSSIYKGNTSKIAQVIAREIQCDLMRTKDASVKLICDYDLIGFGSGIYNGKIDKLMSELILKLPDSVKGKYAFIFCTSRTNNIIYLEEMKNLLLKKGFIILGEYRTFGQYKGGLLRIIGGYNKGRPNRQDFMDTVDFSRKIKELCKNEKMEIH